MKPLETTAYRAPLALRMLDGPTGAAVADGLIAHAWPAGDQTAERTAYKSPVSQLMGFPTLPGLRSQEYAFVGAADANWPPLVQMDFVVTVTDSWSRYLPAVFTVNAPIAAPLEVTLYSAAARPQLPGWATVSGEVHRGVAPASWAVVKVTDGATMYETATDEQGRFLLYVPYPQALPELLGDPPVGAGIGGVSWPLTCSVLFEPGVLTWPVSAGPGIPPDIFSIGAQSPAQLATDDGPKASVTATLHFGTPLQLPLALVPA